MPRLSVPLTQEQHMAIKVKAAQVGLPQAEIARRLLLAWEREEEKLNATELGILKVAVGYLITDHYASRGMLRQSLEELSDKLDRMIDETNPD